MNVSNNLEIFISIVGLSEKVNGIQIFLDLSRSIPHVSLLDGQVTRSVVIDMQILEARLINGMPMLFEPITGRTYLQNTSVAQSSPIAYELVSFYHYFISTFMSFWISVCILYPVCLSVSLSVTSFSIVISGLGTA